MDFVMQSEECLYQQYSEASSETAKYLSDNPSPRQAPGVPVY